VFGVVFGSYYYAIQWFTSVGSKGFGVLKAAEQV
jgi:hypothetical protein